MNERPQFYFSLLRLMAMLRGGDARRAENNGAEAWLGGLAIYLVSYLFFARFIPGDLRLWQAGIFFAGLAFLVWLFWLVVLYLNSLIIKILRLCGFFGSIPDRRAQSILLTTAATGMALSLLQRGSWITEVGAIWLVVVGMNLAAAAILAFRNGGSAAE